MALQVKSAVLAAAGVAVAKVFFPLWFAIPVMTVLGAWGLGMCVRRSSVLVDPGAGLVVVRVGPLRRRVRLADITAVGVDLAKVSLGRFNGGEVSVYVWRKSRLDGWLRVPVEAGEVAHAIARAAAAARQPAPDESAPQAGPGRESVPQARPGPASRRARQPVALTLLGCTGLVALGASFLVRVSWSSPVMTAAGVALALVLGVSGVFYVLFSLWLFLTGRTSRAPRDAARTT